MDPVCGMNRPYCPNAKLVEHHGVCQQAALDKFDTVATIGPKAAAKVFRDQLESTMQVRLAEYIDANKNRDPFKFVAPFVIPLLIALISYVLRIFTDVQWAGTILKPFGELAVPWHCVMRLFLRA